MSQVLCRQPIGYGGVLQYMSRTLETRNSPSTILSTRNEKEGIADRRPPPKAEEPAEASPRPLPRAGPKPTPRPRPPSLPAARLRHAYDPRASAQAYGRLASPWAQARPGLGLGLGLGLGRGPGLCPREPIQQLPNNY